MHIQKKIDTKLTYCMCCCRAVYSLYMSVSLSLSSLVRPHPIQSKVWMVASYSGMCVFNASTVNAHFAQTYDSFPSHVHVSNQHHPDEQIVGG